MLGGRTDVPRQEGLRLREEAGAGHRGPGDQDARRGPKIRIIVEAVVVIEIEPHFRPGRLESELEWGYLVRTYLEVRAAPVA